MRPDPQLAAVFGLTPAAGTTLEGYIKVNPADPVTAAIASETMQFHGVADNYTVNGATVLATLYSGVATTTSFPAVVYNAYGNGHGVAFTYDLAQDVALLRQGNPAQTDTDVDGDDGAPRTVEMFI